MKSHTGYLTFRIPARVGFVNVTPEVEAEVAASGVREGLWLEERPWEQIFYGEFDSRREKRVLVKVIGE